ncbi:40S ribosomal protein S17 [Naganishia vaughanmartiniae]|uniref:40S ribosomal protein S17 n=1 Tax=Naganishia vaughanmartiniae TaxID=1424756 RepID=A0ACC2XED8_9TREE|nr:40S ribosomal protein S17 [Naganishia vaughanmartiniae]
MGRVRTKTVKRASRVLIEKYYPRLTLDFHTNKRILDEVAMVPSKRLRNKISGCAYWKDYEDGFTTHLMKRIQKGPVRGISFRLQEEERERKDQYVPDVSALDNGDAPLDVDAETKDLLRSLGMDSINVNVVAVGASEPQQRKRFVPGAGAA